LLIIAFFINKEKINSHPELLLNEIEILNEKVKIEEEVYKNELKRMELREKTKQKEMEEIKKQSINYLILESYNVNKLLKNDIIYV